MSPAQGGKRRSWIVALLVLGSVAACETSSSRVIGVSTSAPYLDAARLAIHDELAEGPLAGFDSVMNSSGGNNAAPALEAAAEMVSRPGMTAVVGHSNSAASLAAAPLYAEHQVVQLSPTASAVIYSDLGPYHFRLAPPDDRQGGFLAAALDSLLPEGGRIAVFYVNDDYGKGLRRTFLDALGGDRFAVVVDLPHVEDDITEVDVAHVRDALAEARPDAIVWLARGQTLDLHLAVIREVAPDVPILGSDAVESSRIPAKAILRQAYAGVRAVSFVDLGASDVLRAFAARYEERYGRLATGADALTYDAVRLLMAGFRAGAGTGPEMREYLVSLGRERPAFPGITGPIQFDGSGDVSRTYTLVGFGPTEAW